MKTRTHLKAGTNGESETDSSIGIPIRPVTNV